MRSIAAALIFLTAFFFCAAGDLSPATAQTAPRAPAEGGGAVGGRLERLEEHMAELRGVVAAVETLAKNNAGAGSGYSAASGGGASADQIRQLSEQIADLTQRLERLEAQMGGGGRAQAGQPRPDTNYAAAPASGFEDKQQLPPLGAPAERPAPRPQQGSSAVQPRGQVLIAPGDAPAGHAGPQPGPATASASGPARTLFEQATGALNRREYSAAETYFQQFLDEYPADPMAASAQYWLGETAFVSGEYKSAADRFLKTFTAYPASERAPEALLKLAISLRRLGNNTDACATFKALGDRYPQASKSVQQRADAEKKRASCS